MKVAFVSSHAREGGSERYLEALLDALGPTWVAGVVALEPGPMVDRLRSSGHAVHVVATGRRGRVIASLGPLRRAVTELGPDVVHANGVKAALVTSLARVAPPIVWVKHDFSRDGVLTRLVARRCRLVVGVSAAVLGAVGNVPKEVVPTGVDVPSIDRDAARRHVQTLVGDHDAGPLIALVGRMDPAKGHLDLLRAAAALVADHPRLHIVFAGGVEPSHPHHGDRIRAEAAALGLTDRVAFVGHRTDALEVMAGCDVVAVPSHAVDRRGMGREGFGLVGVEAMAVGTPVVGYAAGALPEVLGECACLVAPGDVTALAAAIHDLVDDAGLAARLQSCGRTRVAERYDATAMVEAMQRIYRGLKGLRRATPRRRLRRGRGGPTSPC